jgi:P27 family predicted phage terminase small subunit
MSKSKTKAPAAKAPAVAPPAHLDTTATAKWAELWPIVAQRENIDQGTLDALAAYCLAYSRWTAAETKVSELGAVVKSPAGFAVPNPYVAIAAQAQRQMRQWAQELRRR